VFHFSLPPDKSLSLTLDLRDIGIPARRDNGQKCYQKSVFTLMIGHILARGIDLFGIDLFG
jgi:hypothetical protein